ncbi:hypothetical protein COY27_00675 [Candidatus Woesearchaeota archaeon CG_4_10_14_0_2_um_filter_33_13]|nr:MAG: hypothetical protein COY27_00675 [Candidatus Woesearchaeota archaeon CG_4_10_14_0_2_um_filter_33_13]
MYAELRKIGLTKYEAYVYRALLEYGQSNAKDISEISKVPPTAVYPNLKSLLDKKLIQRLKGEINAYEVINPSVALPEFIEVKKKKIAVLGKDLIKGAEQAYHQKSIVPQKDVVQVSVGKESSTALYKAFEKNCQKSFFILGWKMLEIGNKYSYLKDLKLLIKKGIDVRLIITGSKDEHPELIDAYKQAGIKIRFMPLQNFSLVISDENECKITLKSAELKEKVNVYVGDKDLSKAMRFYYLTVWANAEEV